MELLPKQEQFIFDLDHEVIAYIGGYGSGKTIAGCIKGLILSAYNERTAGMLVSPTYSMMRDTTRRTMFEILEHNNIGFNFRATENKILIHETGSEIWFRSGDDPVKLKGSNLAWVGLDEPALMDKEVYSVSLSRIREPKAKKRQLFITGTHEGFTWVYDELELNNRGKIIRSSTEENIYLPQSYIESLYANYDELHIKQYIKGFATLINRGQVYTSFNREFNVKEFEYKQDLELFIVCDFNVTPMCWGIIQRIKDEDFVINEFVSSNTTTELMCKQLLEVYGQRNYIFYGDYSGTFRSTNSPTTDYDIIKQIIPNCEIRIKPNPPVIDRINAVNSRLCNAKGVRRLFISSRCKHLIKDFEQVIYREGKREIDKSNYDLTHISDAVGYYVEYEYSLRGKSKTEWHYF